MKIELLIHLIIIKDDELLQNNGRNIKCPWSIRKKMNRILLDLPEIIETPRLKLQIPKAGFGEKLHEAISDGYEDYVRWLNWPTTTPSKEGIEEDCRKHHAEFILRDFIRYLIIDKANDNIMGRCAFPSF